MQPRQETVDRFHATCNYRVGEEIVLLGYGRTRAICSRGSNLIKEEMWSYEIVFPWGRDYTLPSLIKEHIGMLIPKNQILHYHHF